MSSQADDTNNCDVHLHAEIELLKKAIVEKQSQLIAMETACMQEHDRQAELEDSIIAWQDKYDRLYESHKRVQKVNQNLEDKLLKLVDRNSGERAQLTSDVATLSVRLAQANYTIANLQRDIERYKTDMGLAIQLLQCKPDSFVPQKITSLPIEIQSKVASYMRLETNSHSDSEGSTSGGVGVVTSGSYSVLPVSESPPALCPFPPTAMVYSMRGLDNKDELPLIDPSPNIINNNNHLNGNSNNNNPHPNQISPSIMAKFLEDELKSCGDIKHCDTCNCSTKELTLLSDHPKTFTIGTQTTLHGSNTNNSLCLRCNSNLNSPSRANSPFIMKLVKSNDSFSIKSDTKSTTASIGGGGSGGGGGGDSEILKPAVSSSVNVCPKKDDLTVNPILSHHRLCDRTTSGAANKNNFYDLQSNKLLSSPEIKTVLNSVTSGGGGEEKITSPKIESKLVPVPIAEDEEELVASNKKTEGNLKNTRGETGDENLCSGGGGGGDGGGSGVRAGGALGSTNSLWSKTSSNADGAKIFENFNLNLIKTIKAENPAMSGPRLCSLRIPNGSNNILLDNFEPTHSPVVYTKRSRFLDEELTDTKDVILTTSLSSATATPSATCDKKISMVMSSNNNFVNGDVVNGIEGGGGGGGGTSGEDGGNVTGGLTTNEINDNKTDSEKYREAHSKDNLLLVQNLDNLKLNYDLDGNEKNSTSSKLNTATQSSSISNSGIDVDTKECDYLRRQQLSRVAEWVQRNSIQQHQQQNGCNAITGVTTNIVECGGESCANDNLDTVSNNEDSISMDELKEQTFDGKLKAQLIRNSISGTTTHSFKNSLSNCNNDHKFAQIMNGMTGGDYLRGDNITGGGGSGSITDGLSVIIDCDLDCSGDGGPNLINPNNDIAQMEYNVRQFLLKQNEWSIHNRLNIVKSPNTTASGNSGIKFPTETNL